MYQFQDQDELRKFIEPVLKIRLKSLEEEHIHMDEEQLFTYLKNVKWQNQTDLHIYEIVDDILNYKIAIRNNGD